ncbi:hypothetical protein [Nostoc sp.]|uniref:hypothetical protein n=1 Tax=Nostoc sp. TaxID=1180 RepID=UPI002FF9CDDC
MTHGIHRDVQQVQVQFRQRLRSCNPAAIARCRIDYNFLAKGVCGTKSDSGGVVSGSDLSSSTNCKTFCCFWGVRRTIIFVRS